MDKREIAIAVIHASGGDPKRADEAAFVIDSFFPGHDDLYAGAIEATRAWAKEGLGFNCTFVDDDMRVIVGIAQRAVLAGLITDFDSDMQTRLREAAEKHRMVHESALGRAIIAA